MYLHSNDAVLLEVSNFISTSKAITSVKYWMDTSNILHLANFDSFCNFPFNNNSFVIGTERIKLDILCKIVGISEWTHSYAEIVNSTSMENDIVICWILLENVSRCIFLEVSEVAVLSVDDSMALSCNGYLHADWMSDFDTNKKCPLVLKTNSEEETKTLYSKLKKQDILKAVECQETFTVECSPNLQPIVNHTASSGKEVSKSFSVDCSPNLQPIIKHSTLSAKEVSKSPEINPFLSQSFENIIEPQLSTMTAPPEDTIYSSPFIKNTHHDTKGTINIELTQPTGPKKRSRRPNLSLRDKGIINSKAQAINKNHQGNNDSSPTPKSNARGAKTVPAKQNQLNSSRADPKFSSRVKFSVGKNVATQHYEENTENDSYSMISPISRLAKFPAMINETSKSTTVHDPSQNIVFNNEAIGPKSLLSSERICQDSSQVNRANLKKRRKFTLPTSSISEFWENDLTASTTLETSAGIGVGEMGNEQKAIFEGFNSISAGIIKKLNSLEEQLKASELQLKKEIVSKFQKLRNDHNENVKGLVKKMSDFAKQMD
ncbi:hypothetical protein CLIB1423_29S00364 [[Candida] railenensis]|uniref:Uncharacterized protein n=1 Tax=[Candida] railenensis TaxID=45579 RepID=A0A9P0W1D4_9ASCO|nr:hypothetical protein CLIB1423_29S00364 [[Candida] railenensis]